MNAIIANLKMMAASKNTQQFIVVTDLKTYEFPIVLVGEGTDRYAAWQHAVGLFKMNPGDVPEPEPEQDSPVPCRLWPHISQLPDVSQGAVFAASEAIATHLPDEVRDWTVQDLIEAIEAAWMEKVNISGKDEHGDTQETA